MEFTRAGVFVSAQARIFCLLLSLIWAGPRVLAQNIPNSPIAEVDVNPLHLPELPRVVHFSSYSSNRRPEVYSDDSKPVAKAAPPVQSPEANTADVASPTSKTSSEDAASLSLDKRSPQDANPQETRSKETKPKSTDKESAEKGDAKKDETKKGDADIEEEKKAIAKSVKVSEGKKDKAWYEKMKIRGYSQFRYNRIAETNPDLRSPQGDRSIGEDGSFLIRRARMIFSGDAGEHVSYYIQPDFASGATGPNPLHFLQIRDFYADVHLDLSKEHRLRVGQSKVPYGFENLQSSQNRLALDRNDPLNSAVVNERDLGVFYYWAPTEIRSRFKSLVDDGLKGSGDYGVLGLGIYNGQTANRPERNNGQHVIGRITYPFLFSNGQIFEPGLCGYTGTYTVERSAGIGGGDDFLDRRGAVSFVLYPQPLGLQGEWTWGQGPELNAAQTAVERSPLEGGYLQFFYKFDDVCWLGHTGTLLPFIRIQRYNGGRKHEINSPSQHIREAEVGFEYQFSKALEFTTNYTFAERTFVNSPFQQERGSLIRTQLQWNY